MEKEFIPYQQALELKELEFDEPCFATYEKLNQSILIQDATRPFVNTNSRLSPFEDQEGYIEQCTAPLYQQAFRWFRDNYNLACYVICYELVEEDGHTYSYEIPKEDCYYNEHFDTYEEAELDLLKKLIEIAKNK